MKESRERQRIGDEEGIATFKDLLGKFGEDALELEEVPSSESSEESEEEKSELDEARPANRRPGALRGRDRRRGRGDLLA